MPIETIEFNGKKYPKLQSMGFASRFSFPLASLFCHGYGYDIGCNRQEWCLPGSEPIDPAMNDFDAYNLPPLNVDYIYSSHCLEHLPNYVQALNYWNSKLKKGGVLFLYLPNCDYQEYWAPTSNKKHLHHMTPHLMKKYFEGTTDLWCHVTVGEGYDLNGSFYCVAEKI